MVFFLTFYSSMHPKKYHRFQKKKNKLIKKIKAAQLFPILIINQHIRMISEGPCIEDWSNEATNSALHHINKLHFKVY